MRVFKLSALPSDLILAVVEVFTRINEFIIRGSINWNLSDMTSVYKQRKDLGWRKLLVSLHDLERRRWESHLSTLMNSWSSCFTLCYHLYYVTTNFLFSFISPRWIIPTFKSRSGKSFKRNSAVWILNDAIKEQLNFQKLERLWFVFDSLLLQSLKVSCRSIKLEVKQSSLIDVKGDCCLESLLLQRNFSSRTREVWFLQSNQHQQN